MQLIFAHDQMVAAAEQGDSPEVYAAIFNFATVGLETTNNPILTQTLFALLPNIQRLQYLSISMGRACLIDKTVYFKTIIDCLETHDIDGGVQAIETYVATEKEYALIALRSSLLIHCPR